MNLGIILPLAIYLVFIFGAALFAYVKRSKGDFLTEYYVGNRSMTGFVRLPLMPVPVLLLVDQGQLINMG